MLRHDYSSITINTLDAIVITIKSMSMAVFIAVPNIPAAEKNGKYIVPTRQLNDRGAVHVQSYDDVSILISTHHTLRTGRKCWLQHSHVEDDFRVCVCVCLSTFSVQVVKATHLHSLAEKIIS